MYYRASWEAWAQKLYPLPVAARAAAQAAIAADASGAGQWNATIAGHRAAVNAGDEYVCKPDRAGLLVVVSVLVFMLFAPASLLGLTVNPALGGFLFLAGSVILPALGVVGAAGVRRNACFFVTREILGRRDWRGRVVASVPRTMVESVTLHTGDWQTVLLTDEGPQESTLVVRTHGAPFPTTALYWWSNARVREFAAVAKL